MNATANERVVWIVGASSGIGEALARAYSGRGTRLVLSSRNETELRRVRASCAQPDGVRVEPLDVTEPATIGRAVERMRRAGLEVDTVVFCAGISQRSNVEETGLDVYRRLMEVDYFGAVALTLQILPRMLERGYGRIVVVSSVVGKFGTPMRSGYAAAKHALHGFFESLRAEVHDRGIRVLLVCPGYIATSISQRALVGDGSRYGKIDAALEEGIPPAVCARRILRAAESGKREIVIAGLRERAAVVLKRWIPGLFSWIVRRAESV